jgi:cobalt/nickel transport system permease protein
MIVSILLILLAKLSIRIVALRLLGINIFILLIWLFIPISMDGETLMRLGPFDITKEGIIYSTIITMKSNAIAMALMALIATMPVFTLGRAMRYLYIPSKIINLFLFTYRYIHAIHREYMRLANAIKIRGFRPRNNIHTYKTYAYLLGMLLVKSHDRAERVYAAMLCRGFRGRFYDLSEFSFKKIDLLTTPFILLILLFIFILEWTKIIY